MNRFKPYLANIDHLIETSAGDKKESYIHPSRKNIGCISLVVLREAIAPVVFRNLEQEITDIEIGRETHIRAVPNKFKYPEKGRGLQILRAYGVGGRLPQNRTVLKKGQNPSEAYDMNTLVFGDSCVQENKVLSVKTAVNYSDGLSILPKHFCVEESFHNRAMEDGSLWDSENKKNSDNLFTRHFISPGVLIVEVLSSRGKVLPTEGLDHLLLCMGIAGAYGGQTSTTGVNIKTRLVGLYGGKFERPETSPYEIIKWLRDKDTDKNNGDSVTQILHEHMKKVHETDMGPNELTEYQLGLVEKFEKDDRELRGQYETAAPKIAELFDSWFMEKKR